MNNLDIIIITCIVIMIMLASLSIYFTLKKDTSHLRNFYYSAKQREIASSDPNHSYITKYVVMDGMRYEFTERTDYGKPPISMWDDVVFLGTASTNQCYFERGK